MKGDCVYWQGSRGYLGFWESTIMKEQAIASKWVPRVHVGGFGCLFSRKWPYGPVISCVAVFRCVILPVPGQLCGNVSLRNSPCLGFDPTPNHSFLLVFFYFFSHHYAFSWTPSQWLSAFAAFKSLLPETCRLLSKSKSKGPFRFLPQKGKKPYFSPTGLILIRPM